MNKVYKMRNEIYLLQEAIHKYVDNNGGETISDKLEKTTDKLMKALYLSNENPEFKLRLAYFIENTSICKLLEEEPETKHAILCCIAKKLKCFEPIPKENIFPDELMEYDPSKNGQNILKHDIDFKYFISNQYLIEKGQLLVPTKTKNGECRIIYFLSIKNKNVLTVVTQPKNSQCKGFRYISARYFSDEKSKIEKTLKEVIKDDDLKKESLEEMRKIAYQYLEKYRYTK